MDYLPNGNTRASHSSHPWWDRIRAIFLLDDDVDETLLVQHWKASVYRIIVISSMLLCLLVAGQALVNAWQLGITSVIVVVLGYYVALVSVLAIERRAPRLAATLLLAMIYLCGFLILFGVSDSPLSDLGVIFLYVAPTIGWIYFGVRGALLLMLFNCLPFAFMLMPQRPVAPFSVDMLIPSSHAYLHGLLFLFFNVSIPLAFFRVFAAKQNLFKRYAKTNARLQKSVALYEDMFEHAGGPTLICDQGGSVLKANRQALALLARPLLDTSEPLYLADLFTPLVPEAQFENLLSAALSHGRGEGEFVAQASTVQAGREVMLSVQALSSRCLLIAVRDLSSLRSVERELLAAEAARRRLTAFDYLTDLPNGDYLGEKLRELMQDNAAESAMELYAVVSLRLNSVRSVNQKYGQGIGDELIREFARQLQRHADASIMPCRMRGVVFALLIRERSNAEQLKNHIEQYLQALPKSCEVGGHAIELHFSAGAAYARDADISIAELIHRSESALETARKTTSARVVFFNEDIARESNRESEIEMAFSGALARGELHMVYQPKVDENRHIKGLEALLRWNSTELGPLSPAEFIPVAERTGRIHAITDFVITHVCAQLRQWLNQYGSAWPVAINLSGIDLQREDIAAFLIGSARAQHIMPALLHVEITETGLIEDDVVALRNLQVLTDAGFRIAIDDFGTGYSSLKKLSDYPINMIKIDRSFVLSIGNNGRSEQIIRLILALANFLHCEAVAEGVETSEQLQFLTDNGCISFQGYLFYRPMTEAGIGLLLSERH